VEFVSLQFDGLAPVSDTKRSYAPAIANVRVCEDALQSGDKNTPAGSAYNFNREIS
jgi:hypothetical protein